MACTYLALPALRKALLSANDLAGVAEEAFRPFDLSQLRRLPRETDRPALTDARRAGAHAATRRTVQPPAVRPTLFARQPVTLSRRIVMRAPRQAD